MFGFKEYFFNGFKLNKNKENFTKGGGSKDKVFIRNFSRLLGSGAAMFTIVFVLEEYDEFYKDMRDVQKSIVVELDYFSNSYCQESANGEKVVFMKGGLISIAHKNQETWEFRVDKCTVSD